MKTQQQRGRSSHRRSRVKHLDRQYEQSGVELPLLCVTFDLDGDTLAFCCCSFMHTFKKAAHPLFEQMIKKGFFFLFFSCTFKGFSLA